MTEKTMYFIDPMQRTIEGVVPMIARLRYPDGEPNKGKIEFFKTDWNWGNDPEIALQCVRDKNEILEADTDMVSLYFPQDLAKRARY